MFVENLQMEFVVWKKFLDKGVFSRGVLSKGSLRKRILFMRRR